MPHEVFISYSTQDKPFADAVCASLESRRIRCWIAPRDILPGVEYAEAIIDAIDGCRILALVLSSNSNLSPHVRKEVQRAVARGVHVLPIRIEDVLLSKPMEYYIGNYHWLDAMTPPFEQHLQRLADYVKLILTGRQETETPSAVDPVPASPGPAKPTPAPEDDLASSLDALFSPESPKPEEERRPDMEEVVSELQKLLEN